MEADMSWHEHVQQLCYGGGGGPAEGGWGSVGASKYGTVECLHTISMMFCTTEIITSSARHSCESDALPFLSLYVLHVLMEVAVGHDRESLLLILYNTSSCILAAALDNALNAAAELMHCCTQHGKKQNNAELCQNTALSTCLPPFLILQPRTVTVLYSPSWHHVQPSLLCR